ncbi:putative auxin-binding protein [Candidatus Burkholderia humilis]|nr:putative auxin-binding protein [Candidatus Burkholderia humilis]
MPKIDIAHVPQEQGSGYPSLYDRPLAERIRQRLGDACGLRDFGINLIHLPPGNWSSRRHWHSHEDEFVYVLQGELVLIEDEGETLLRAGDCAAFPKGTGNGHHMINRSAHIAVYLEAGSRVYEDMTTCSDVDMKSANADGRFVRKDGTDI